MKLARPERTGNPPIPVLRPLLPKADKLLPYLERIDESRIYSNWGPLVSELGERLCAMFAVPPGGVVCANSGMSALMGAILAAAGTGTTRRPLAIVPDYTFTATALAAQFCGYEVVLAGCHSDSWTFSAERLQGHPDLLNRTGLVVPVAPYGRLVSQTEWLQFTERTGIPVAIDGAACFESLLVPPREAVGPIPVALSFHATKSFATGEGGCVVSTDADLSARTLQYLNFGFFDSRNSRVGGFNGKMSEYAAAIGLAELDGWSLKRRRQARVFDGYRRTFAAAEIGEALWGPPDISSSYLLMQCRTGSQAEAVIRALAADEIGTRLWYGNGLNEHDNFKDSLRLDLYGSATLDPRLLVGLPIAPDLRSKEIERISDRISCALRAAGPVVSGAAGGPVAVPLTSAPAPTVGRRA